MIPQFANLTNLHRPTRQPRALALSDKLVVWSMLRIPNLAPTLFIQ